MLKNLTKISALAAVGCMCSTPAPSEPAVHSSVGLGHVALDRNLLRALGLSSESSKIVMDYIVELRSEIKKAKRITLLEASSEVAGHWNDRATMVNQYEQAQRSAGILQRQGYAIECPNDQAHRPPPKDRLEAVGLDSSEGVSAALPGTQSETNAAPEAAPADSVRRIVSLLTDGIAAAEGAQVIAELYFEQQSRDPSNNDNYCRLMDWLKAARRHRAG